MISPVSQPKSSVFITNATGAGTVDSKSYVANTMPADRVLTAFTSDNDSVVIHLLINAPPGARDWQPDSTTVYGGSAPVTVAKQDWVVAVDNEARTWTAEATIDATLTATIYATVTDGARSQDCAYTRALDPPLVTDCDFATHATNTGGDPLCPYSQTEVSGLDDAENTPQTVRITGTAEAHATHVYVDDWEVCAGYGSDQGPFTVTAGAFDFTVTVGPSANSAARHARVRAVAGIGSTPGAWNTTDNTVTASTTLPAFGSPSADYPGTQEALKGVEDAEVTLTCSNWVVGDTAAYSDNGTAELEISNSQNGAEDLTTYQVAKWAERKGGTYRDDDDSANYKLTVTRSGRNGTINSATAIVEIANVAAVVTIARNSSGSALYRMGTDDGTVNYKDRYVYVVSNQKTKTTTTPQVTSGGGGAFTGSWARYGDYCGRKYYRVADADFISGGQGANTYTWGACQVYNRAGTLTSVVTTYTTYTLGGFAERTLTIAAWPNREGDIGCLVVNTAKLACENLSKGGDGPGGGTIFTFDNSPGSGTPDDGVDEFCITNGSAQIDDDNRYWYNRDQLNAVSNTSGTAQVLIEETA